MPVMFEVKVLGCEGEGSDGCDSGGEDDGEAVVSTQSTGSLMGIVKALCVVTFHHERGDEIEWYRGILSESERYKISHSSLPDQSHKFLQDYCYFRVDSLYCVSCFRQENAKLGTNQTQRSMVQKSVVAVCTKPVFGAVRLVLEPFTKAYFLMGNFSDRFVLEHFYSGINQRLNQLFAIPEELFFQGTETRKFVREFGRDSLILYKALWLKKRIAFYGIPASSVADRVLGFLSLIPNFLVSIFGSTYFSEKETQERKLFHFPDVVFHDTFWDPYLPIQGLDSLKHLRAFVIGSSNALVATSAVSLDVLVNLTTGEITWFEQNLEETCQLSMKDEQFIDWVVDAITHYELDETPTKDRSNEGSDEWVRETFKEWSKCFLSVLVDSTQVLPVSSLDLFNSDWVKKWQTTVLT
eukprot:TRINITY_DN7347_c0_g1_i2.p1 TRINITY_DN7347_c0_g1~~TRINITY_DN7347_c0_g1_i2.p1  ORF type:complete len:410 (-),score=80.03 TRINITY_DN7347_c0_g1_i2:817-2046(-)